jgi:DNA modification methylase
MSVNEPRPADTADTREPRGSATLPIDGCESVRAWIHSTDDPFVLTAVRGLRAARWKRHPLTWKTGQENAQALALELERRLERRPWPYEITIVNGRVNPAPGRIELLKEPGGPTFDEEPLPEWVDGAEHSWVRLTRRDRATRIVADIATPPPSLLVREGNDNPVFRIYDDGLSGSPDTCPLGYEPNTATAFTEVQPTEGSLYSTDTPVWPCGVPTYVNAVPADGGREQIETNTVIQGHVLEVLENLPRDSIDVVFTSPPYRLQRRYQGADTVWDADPNCNHEWQTDHWYHDSPVRGDASEIFADKHTDQTNEQRLIGNTQCLKCGGWKGELGLEPTRERYLDHLTQVFDAIKRVVRPHGSVVVNIDDNWSQGHTTDDGSVRDAPHKSLTGVPSGFAERMLDHGWLLPERYIWVKDSPTPNGTVTDRATNAFEHVFRFVRDSSFYDDGDPPSTNVLELSSGTDSDHPAPMPPQLPEALLPRITPEDGLVLDPFCGGGTVLVTAAKIGYDTLGIEISDVYAETARNRLDPYITSHDQQGLNGQTGLGQF